MVTRLILLAIGAVIAGCGVAPAKPSLDFCLLSAPIYVSAAHDVLTPETKKAILAHNERGAALCGWKPITQTKGAK